MGKRILVADNDEYGSAELARLLVQKGYDVRTAANGCCALRLLSARQFDGLILDLRLPDENGFEVLGRLDDASRPRCIILLSAVADSYVVSAAGCLGVDRVMLKPWSAEAIAAELEEILTFAGGAGSRRFMRPEEKRVTDVLRKIAMPIQRKGYVLLKEELLLIVQNRSLTGSMTERLYPEIGKRHNTKPETVERLIRAAMEEAWKKPRTEQQIAFLVRLGLNPNDRPTNKKLVTAIVDYLDGESAAKSV